MTRTPVISGVRVGHWTDPVARTGCTVVLLPAGNVASGEVRGGAPATREFDLLGPTRLVEGVHAVVLTGGSAFGLAAADGVAAWLAERGVGFPTLGGPVPIVVAMALYDLTVGDGTVRPGPAEGRSACETATGDWAGGRVGAGTGATVGKAQGAPRPGGLGVGVRRDGEVAVAAMVAVNAYGDLDDGSRPLPIAPGAIGTNTTIGVVLTNSWSDKAGCRVLAEGAQDGMARALWPPHATVDGDAVVAVSTRGIDVGGRTEVVRALAVAAMQEAVAAAVRP